MTQIRGRWPGRYPVPAGGWGPVLPAASRSAGVGDGGASALLSEGRGGQLPLCGGPCVETLKTGGLPLPAADQFALGQLTSLLKTAVSSF